VNIGFIIDLPRPELLANNVLNMGFVADDNDDDGYIYQAILHEDKSTMTPHTPKYH